MSVGVIPPCRYCGNWHHSGSPCQQGFSRVEPVPQSPPPYNASTCMKELQKARAYIARLESERERWLAQAEHIIRAAKSEEP